MHKVRDACVPLLRQGPDADLCDLHYTAALLFLWSWRAAFATLCTYGALQYVKHVSTADISQPGHAECSKHCLRYLNLTCIFPALR